MKQKCQDCQQPLEIPSQIEPTTTLKDSQYFNVIEENQVKNNVPSEQLITKQPLYLMTGLGEKVDSQLLVRDLVDSNLVSGLQLSHPICFECFDKILKQLDSKIKDQEDECNQYAMHLVQLERAVSIQKRAQPEPSEVKKLEDEEKELDRQIAELEVEEQRQNAELECLGGYHSTIQNEENVLWSDFNRLEKAHNRQQEQRMMMGFKTSTVQKMLKKLQESSFINEVFQIGAVDEIATIGGFRLGKTQRVDVSWEEINAAMGQVAYLMVVLAHRLQYKFDKYYIHVDGSYSKISIGNDKSTKMELYYTSSGSAEERYNRGLVMLLDALNRFLDHLNPLYSRLVQHQNKEVRLFEINMKEERKETINKSEIRYSSEGIEAWTRACKCVLAQLQWICYVSKLKDEDDQMKAHQSDPVYQMVQYKK